MKKIIVLAAILALSLAACSERSDLDSTANAATIAPPQPTAEEVAKAKQAAEEKARNFEKLKELWAKVQAGPPTTPDWKAQLDGQKAENSVLCQVVWFGREIDDFGFYRDKASAEELQQIRFSETLLA